MTISLLSVALAVAAGVSYAVLDLLRKRLTTNLGALALLVWLALAPVPLFAVAAFVGGWHLESSYWMPGLISIGVNVVANLAFLRALETAPLGLTVPLLSLTPVFASVMSIWVLGELPSILQWVGIGSVVVGAFALNYDPGDGATLQAVWRSLTREKGSMLMIVTALGWSITPPFDKLAAEASGTYEHGMLLNLGVALATLAVVAIRGELASLRLERSDLRLLTGSAVVSFVALVVLLEAYAVVWVGFVETVRRAVNSELALVFGGLYFRETIRKAQIVAVVLMSLGVGLIFL